MALAGLISGHTYTVLFLAALRPNYLALPVSIAFNGAAIGTFTPLTTAFSQFTGFNFIAAGTSGTLTCAGLSPTPTASNDQNTAIDNVTIAAAVPEPATWAMIIFGFGLVGGTMRRRRIVNAAVAHA